MEYKYFSCIYCVKNSEYQTIRHGFLINSGFIIPAEYYRFPLLYAYYILYIYMKLKPSE